MEAFGKVRAEEKLKKDIVEFASQNTWRRNIFMYRQFMPAVAACLLMLIIGGSGYLAFFTSISTISIDVNPSFELGINRFDRVVSTEAYNEGGSRVLADTNVRFMDYRDAIDLILADESMAQYVESDQYIAVTVFGKQEEKSNIMLANLASCTASYVNVHCSAGNYSEVAEAHMTGMSCGKYNAYLELKSLVPEITVDEVERLTMLQIQDRINGIIGGVQDNAQDDMQDNMTEYGNEWHGMGHGHGHE